MRQYVLIADDDLVMRRLLKHQLESCPQNFLVQTAVDGRSAIGILEQKSISLILADFRMPDMDGIELLDYVSVHYPDIPVIIMADFSERRGCAAVVRKKGGGCFEKPLNIEALIGKIEALFKKQAEGGILNGASLETFVQLIEMEQKTATIRVHDRSSEQTGVLFFKEGEFLNARIRALQGESAACEIFTWEQVTLFIENQCRISKKKIDKELQAVLLEAMRLKDELMAETPAAGSPDFSDGDTSLDDSVKNVLSASEKIMSKLEALGSETRQLAIMKPTDFQEHLINVLMNTGDRMAFGEMKACFVSNGESLNHILVNGEERLALAVRPKSFHDRILQTIVE